MSDFGAGLEWRRLRAFLPFDLDGLAFETGLLTRRRGVSCGEDLARLLLMLALPGATCERVGRWAGERGLARMGATAVFARASRAEPFLSALLAAALSHAASPQPGFRGYRLLAVDATALCGPGARGTDQRLHAAYDLASGALASFELTDARGGETLARHALPEGSLLLADRGYGHARGLAWALDSGAVPRPLRVRLGPPAERGGGEARARGGRGARARPGPGRARRPPARAGGGAARPGRAQRRGQGGLAAHGPAAGGAAQGGGPRPLLPALAGRAVLQAAQEPPRPGRAPHPGRPDRASLGARQARPGHARGPLDRRALFPLGAPRLPRACGSGSPRGSGGCSSRSWPPESPGASEGNADPPESRRPSSPSGGLRLK